MPRQNTQELVGPRLDLKTLTILEGIQLIKLFVESRGVASHFSREAFANFDIRKILLHTGSHMLNRIKIRRSYRLIHLLNIAIYYFLWGSSSPMRTIFVVYIDQIINKMSRKRNHNTSRTSILTSLRIHILSHQYHQLSHSTFSRRKSCIIFLSRKIHSILSTTVSFQPTDTM